MLHDLWSVFWFTGPSHYQYLCHLWMRNSQYILLKFSFGITLKSFWHIEECCSSSIQTVGGQQIARSSLFFSKNNNSLHGYSCHVITFKSILYFQIGSNLRIFFLLNQFEYQYICTVLWPHTNFSF